VMTNAVYLNAAWMAPFARSATSDGDFEAPQGSVRVPFMQQVARFGYFRGEGFQLLELPYVGGEVVAYVLLPDAAKFDRVDRSLTPHKFGWMRDQLRRERVDVKLPKFEFRSKLAMKDTLEAMGMKAPFVPKEADFSAMFARPGERVFVSEVFHEGFISVDEAGTEAAAATGGVMRATGGSLDSPKQFHADRPFTFFVVDEPTGAILFTARVLDPS